MNRAIICLSLIFLVASSLHAQEKHGPEVRISAAAKDKDGLLIHEVESPCQKGKTQILVLTPDKMEESKKYPVVYVLPVEPGTGTRWGHGLLEIKRLDLHNKLGVIFVMPTFSDWPWYCDHPTDPQIRQETYFLAMVVPYIERTYPVVPGQAGRLLLGFSKSGWGAFSLLLRHPEFFGRAAAWDAPLNMAAPNQFGMKLIFGTEENFEKYQISSLLTKQTAKLRTDRRLAMIGYSNFRPHHAAIHEQMMRLGIPHEYRDVRQGKHDWRSGWIEDAVSFLVSSNQPWVQVAKDKKSFVLEPSGESFTPWGFNYDHDTPGRLIEDYWETEWDKVEAHFSQMKKLGAKVVRIHLQAGKFMEAADKPNEKALDRLGKLMALAEKNRIYLDLTGLGCYHKADVPAWYDKLSEKDRWDVQARFWEAVAGRCAKNPAIFCYDLMNEPVVPSGKRKDGDWLGPPFGGKHFVQVITLDQQNRPRHEIARQWIKQLVAAIRKHDKRHLITVGLVDWSLDRPGLTSGFVPDKIGDDLDFICVHLYPDRGKVDEALKILEGFAAVGKPVVIEETFPLKCSVEEFGQFIDKSKQHAAGWIGFYWGKPPDELRKSESIGDAMMLGWLEYFQKAAAESNEPVTFEFKRKCGPAEGREYAFDAKAQTYYLHVNDIARFEIKAVAPDLEKRMVVLKITGMLDKAEGPLTLYVPEKGGKNKEFKLSHLSFDNELFRIERKDGVNTIEFLPKGRKLLGPGVWFQYVDFYRN